VPWAMKWSYILSMSLLPRSSQARLLRCDVRSLTFHWQRQGGEGIRESNRQGKEDQIHRCMPFHTLEATAQSSNHLQRCCLVTLPYRIKPQPPIVPPSLSFSQTALLTHPSPSIIHFANEPLLLSSCSLCFFCGTWDSVLILHFATMNQETYGIPHPQETKDLLHYFNLMPSSLRRVCCDLVFCSF
jgi:hypothetical protein